MHQQPMSSEDEEDKTIRNTIMSESKDASPTGDTVKPVDLGKENSKSSDASKSASSEATKTAPDKTKRAVALPKRAPDSSGTKRPAARAAKVTVTEEAEDSPPAAPDAKKPASAHAKKSSAGGKAKKSAANRSKKGAKAQAKKNDSDELAEKAKSDRPRYAFVVPRFDRSGTQSEAYAVSVVHELARRGNEVLVITGSGQSDDEHVTIRRANPLIMGRKAIKTFKPRRIIDWGYNIPAEFRHVDSPYEQELRHSIGACKGLSRLVKQFHLHFSRHHRSYIHKQRALMRVSKAQFLAQSDLVAEDLKRAGVNADRIHLLPYGVDLDRFSPDNAGEAAKKLRSDHGFMAEDVVFLCVTDDPELVDIGSLRAVFSRVHEKNPHIRLLHMGEADPGWGDSWFVHISRAEQPEAVFGAADALVHPAVYDSAAPVVIQAMAAGLPVVTSENIGSLQLVRDSGGALFAPVRGPESKNAWSEAVQQLADSADKRKQLGHASRTAASRRTLASFVDRFEEALNKGA